MVALLEADSITEPPLTPNMVSSAEASLGYRLPRSYLDLLEQCNGGRLTRQCVPTAFPTSWADDHFQIDGLLGIGGTSGIDSELVSRYLVAECEYPDVGIVIGITPSAGEDTVMLDYSDCGPMGDPAVAYVDENRVPRRVADSFDDFLSKLTEC